MYMNWMENIRDWCISRQLWWGHRIPAYYCDECGEMIVAREAPCTVCPKCGAHTCIRTRTCSIPGSPPRCGRSPRWAGRTRRRICKYFYPTDVLVTGYDIIFFWVARMIFSGIEQMGKAPFHTVVHARPGARRAGPQNVQVAGQRHRSAWRSSTSTARTRSASRW